MKTKVSIILFTTISIILCISCSIKNYNTRIVDGVKYKLVSPAKTNDNGIIDNELWQKEGVTNRYYTPSLSGNSMLPIMSR